MSLRLKLIKHLVKFLLKGGGHFIKYSRGTPLFYRLADLLVAFVSSQEEVFEIDGFKIKKGRTTRLMILTREPPEPATTNLIKKNAKPNMVVFDLGANAGWFTLIFSKLVGPKGHVYSFEPDPQLFNILKENIELNNLKNVSSFQSAVSNKAGTASLTLNYSQDGDNRLDSKSMQGESIEVKTTTIDLFCKTHNIKPDFLKMDVQGSEPSILAGMKNVISLNPNLKIITEFYGAAIEDLGNSPEEYLKALEEKFIVKEIVENGNFKLMDIQKEKLLRKKNQSFNLFCYKQ